MSEIDPQLPFIQIHRSVGAKAAQLAAVLGVSHQHVRGSLEVFWESLADRRLWSGKSELVLGEDEISQRLTDAFGGLSVDLKRMIRLGFLEPRGGDTYRIRGMSPYLEAELRRLEQVAKRANRQSSPGLPPVHHRSTTGPPVVGHQSGTGQQPADQRPTEVRDERREVRGERLETKDESSRPAAAEQTFAVMTVEPPTSPQEQWLGEDFWRWAQVRRQAGRYIAEKPPDFRKLSSWWSAVRLHVQDVKALKEAFYAFADDPHWQAAKPPYPFAGFMAQWRKYLPQGGARVAAT